MSRDIVPTTGEIVTNDDAIDTNDSRVIALWLHGRSPHTQRAYKHDVDALLDFTGKSLQVTTLSDLQDFADSLGDRSKATQARTLKAVKSLLTFAYKHGYTRFNVGAVLRLPKIKNQLASRIMDEEETIRMMSLEKDPRNHAILRLLYHTGMRVSELVSLTWQDITRRDTGAQITIYGKGGKTREVLITPSVYDELLALTEERGSSTPVFRSHKTGGALQARQVERIVKEAAKCAGVHLDGEKCKVSPHWLRHAHASHSLDRGAPIHLVQQTLGHENMATTGKYTHAKPQASSGQFLAL